MRELFTSVLIVTFCSPAAWGQAASDCPSPDGLAMQVLGSGGPIADDGRASAAYIVWVNGESRVMIDAGGGSFLRFAEAGANFTELDFIGLSHLHADHSIDFTALLKSGNFSGRDRELTVSGPDAGGPFPGLQEHLDRLLNPETGAYRYLSGYLDGSGGLAKLLTVEVSKGDEAVQVFENPDIDLRIDALHVPHGVVPALGFRVHVGDVSIVFSSDQNGTDPAFTEFARRAEMLVMHMPLPENATGPALQLHARPSAIADIAKSARVNTLVLSHFMGRSLQNFDDNLNVVRAGYAGNILVAEDLLCVAFDGY